MGIVLRHLVFIGDGTSARLDFSRGLNIVYGASNTGKSFIVKTLEYMFGAGKLPKIEQLNSYSAILLGLTLPDGRDVTLYRATGGGNLLQFEGLHEGRPSGTTGLPLQSKHRSDSLQNVSQFVLSSIALSGKQIVKKANGAKDSFALRHLVPFVLVGETEMMGEDSPVLTGQFKDQTLDKNIFRLLLTG